MTQFDDNNNIIIIIRAIDISFCSGGDIIPSGTDTRLACDIYINSIESIIS